MLVILLLAAVGAGVYFWQQQKVNDLETNVKTLNAKVILLNKQLSKAASKQSATTAVKATAPTSTDEQAIAAAKQYCNAKVNSDTKQPLVFTVGKVGPNNKQVLYSADNNFATISASCSKDGKGDGGSGSTFYLKKVNGNWVFLLSTQQLDPADAAIFNLPNEFN